MTDDWIRVQTDWWSGQGHTHRLGTRGTAYYTTVYTRQHTLLYSTFLGLVSPPSFILMSLSVSVSVLVVLLLLVSVHDGCCWAQQVTFGTGLSSNRLYAQPIEVFNHTLAKTATHGVMTHFWATGLREESRQMHDTILILVPPLDTWRTASCWSVYLLLPLSGDPAVDSAIWSYYIDGESIPSIVFNSGMITGVGFGDGTGPWGTQLMGKGAKSGAWYSNIRIPFQSSIRITGECDPSYGPGCEATVWVIVRGTENLPIHAGRSADTTNCKNDTAAD